MKWIITGGLGFIGTELVKQLLNNNENVLVIDNLSNSNKITEEIKKNKNFKLIKKNILDKDGLNRILYNYNYDFLIHLAAIHYIPLCNKFPNKTIRTNIEGTQNIFDACIDTQIKKIINISSGAIYGDNKLKLKENSRIDPQDIYGLTKLMGEKIARIHPLKKKIISLRLFNTYGEKETNKHIIPEILKQLKKNDYLKLGNINTVRDFIHVSDVAKAIIKICKTKTNFTEYNLSGDESFTMKNIIKIISKFLNKKIKVKKTKIKLRKNDKKFQISNISRIKKDLLWEPETKFSEGINNLLINEKLIK